MSFGFGSSQSLFGQTQSQPSLFGNQGPSSQPLFQTNQAQNQPSLFGSAQPQPQPQPQPSLFGSGQAQSQPSLFGAPQQQSTPSLFAPQSQPLFSSPQQQSQPSLFGAQPQSQAAFFSQPSLFPAQSSPASSIFIPQSTSSLFQPNQQQQLQQQQQQQQQQQYSLPAANAQPQSQLPASLIQIIDGLNPLHPSSPFQAALYNVVPASVIPLYQKPGPMHSVLWQVALSANPDPSRQVPVHANGFDDLLVRAQTQSNRVNDHKAVLNRLQSDVANIQQDVNTELSTKLSAYRRRHRELARKLLRIASTVELVAARSDTVGGLSAIETDRRKRLEGIGKALAAPAEFKDKLCDLIEVAGATVLDQRVRAPVTIRDQRAADALRELLSNQLQGIQQLGTVCSKIDRDLVIMNNILPDRKRERQEVIYQV